MSVTSSALFYPKTTRRVHTGGMRFRGILGGLLAALLLSLSTTASICQVRCALGSMAPSCHEVVPQAQNHQPMPPMEGMPQEGGASAPRQTKAVSLANAACANHVCSQLSAKVSELTALDHTQVMVAVVSQTTLQFSAEPSHTKPPSRDPPDLRETTPVSLRTTLRV